MKTNRIANYYRLSVIGAALLLSTTLWAQKDEDELNRSVTVERDFQPVIQAAGKVSTKPAVVTTTIEPAPVEYSDYTAEVQTEASINPMLSQPTRFEPSKKYNGYIRGGLGHTNTLFDFGYHLDDGKQSILDVYAHHRAVWGTPALSKTKLGFDFAHPFSTCDLYFGVNGGNLFYHRHGDLYESGTPNNSTSLWSAEAFIGVKANAKQDFQYLLQTGYMIFAKSGAVNEHQIRTKGSFDWHSEAHHVGLNTYVQNNLLQLTGLSDVIPDSLYTNCHDIRIEPYYAYEGRRVQLHIGLNLDVNVGSGHNSLSSLENVSFAPSPHIRLEAQVAKEWLTIYADVMGEHGSGSLQDFMEENRYRLIHQAILDHHFASYTPVDAELGFHIRPHRNLLVELHGGYAYMLKQMNLIANTDSAMFAPLNMKLFAPGDFNFFYATYQRGKIGGQMNYHYRDYVRVNLDGNYFIWKSDSTVLDRPNWELGLRIDGRIDQHWSLYSENRFEGSRKALVADGSIHRLKPRIDLNLGVQYEMWLNKNGKITEPSRQKNVGTTLHPEPKPNLVLFAQLNDFIHHKNEIYYGYHTIGINFLIGATFRF